MLFTKNVKEVDNLIQKIKIYSQDIGMEFGIEKCAMKSGKRQSGNGRIRTTKSRKNKNTQRKGKLQVLEKIRSGHHQTSG